MATLPATSTPLPVLNKILSQHDNNELSDYEDSDLSNVVRKPILQQEKSSITTNAFIPDNQKQSELSVVQLEANDIILKQYNQNITSSIQNLSLADINRNISKSCIGLLDDSFNKPDNITWIDYIQIIIKKDQRYTYIGFLFIFIAFYILLVSN